MQLPEDLKEAIDSNAFCAIATHVSDNVIQNHLSGLTMKMKISL